MVYAFRRRLLPWLLAFVLAVPAAGCGALAQFPGAIHVATPSQPVAGSVEEPHAHLATVSGERALAHVHTLAGEIGPRLAGSPAETAAADYIAHVFAGYGLVVERQLFTFPQFEDRGTSIRVQFAGVPLEGESVLAQALLYSAQGDVNGRLVYAGFGRDEEFPPAARGAIVLIERGAGITFRDKVEAAARAGALGAIIFNNQPHTFNGSLQMPSAIPVAAISGADGQRLLAHLQNSAGTVHLSVDASVSERQSENVIATLSGTASVGASGERIVAGAHYDSVQSSPGANDNASGTAVILELARVLAQAPPTLDVVFVAFGAEELGLLGSAHYVASLTPDEQTRIAAMLNFDMVGVGDQLLAGGDIALLDQLDAVAAPLAITYGRLPEAASKRSDQASFMAVGVPSVFMHVGDDPNYHTPDDVPAHVSAERLEQVARTGEGLVRHLTER